MKNLLLLLMLFLPPSVVAQTSFDLPDGSSIQAYLMLPEPGQDPLPLAIVMGGGPGNGQIAERTFNSLGAQFVSHGWAVVTPVSPNGQSFWDENAEKVRQLIMIIKARDEVQNGPVLLAGISNGGSSSLEIAAHHPREYLGVVAVPGLAVDSTLRTLRNFPVYLRIGSEDQLGWANRFTPQVDAMNRNGIRLNALLMQGEGHRVNVDWENLEPWLAELWQ
jgi:dienelactone hydrolase